MQDIFLSYSSKDRDRLAPLVAALEAEGWTVFWDHRSIKVAQDWHDVIGQAIQQCPVVLVAWSGSSVLSRWVKEEALIGRDRGVLYPVMIDQVTLPFGFNLIQAADFTAWDGLAEHPEFVELKEQLSLRLNLRRKLEKPALAPEPVLEITRSVDDERSAMQPVMGGGASAAPDVLIDSLKANVSGLKVLGALAVGAVLAGAGYWYTQQPVDSGSTAGQQQETVQIEQAVVKDKPVVEAPAPEPKTYELSVKAEPAGALVRVNEKALQEGQRFTVGTYTLSVTAEGYKPYQKQIELRSADHRHVVSLERLRLPFEPKMVEILGGTFQMGCDPERDNSCNDDEAPLHEVTVPQFWLSETEVTVGQFRPFIKATHHKTDAEKQGSCYGDKTGKDGQGYVEGNYWDKPGFEQTETHPVTCVSWNDAKKYVTWLSKKTGESYRLPSEAEWEYAARAGTVTAYPWGRTADHEFANYGKDNCCGGMAKGKDEWFYTAPVGSFPANAFDLKDMHGNVWEWVEDCWVDNHKNAPDNDAANTACEAGTWRVLRGGSWANTPKLLRSVYGFDNNSSARNTGFGFRVAKAD